MSSGRKDHALDAVFVKTLGQVFALIHPLLQVLNAPALVQSRGQGHDVPAGHSAVRVVAVAGNLLYLQQNSHVRDHVSLRVKVGEILPEQALVPERKDAAHVGVAVLFQAGGKSVAVGKQLFCDGENGFVLITHLVHLDKIAVLGPAGGVQHEGDSVLVGDAAGFPNVGHGNRLSAHRVVGDGGVDQRNIFRAHLLNQGFQLCRVHISLEGILLIDSALRHLPEKLLVKAVAGCGAHLLDVALRGVEMAVGGDGEILTWMALPQDFADHGEQYALSGAPLGHDEGVGALHLGRASVEQSPFIFTEIHFIHHFVNVLAVRSHQIDHPLLIVPPLEHIPERLHKHIISLVASVGLVPQEHGAPLHVRHGGSAGIRQHIHGQHARRKCKFIVVGGFERPLALLHRHIGDVALYIRVGFWRFNV